MIHSFSLFLADGFAIVSKRSINVLSPFVKQAVCVVNANPLLNKQLSHIVSINPSLSLMLTATATDSASDSSPSPDSALSCIGTATALSTIKFNACNSSFASPCDCYNEKTLKSKKHHQSYYKQIQCHYSNIKNIQTRQFQKLQYLKRWNQMMLNVVLKE